MASSTENPDDFFSPALPECRASSHPSLPQFIISCTLMAWVLLSYLPQYARIISRQSAEGLSTLYILLGALSGVCAVGNILMLPTSDISRHCCRDPGLSWFACVSGLLGIGQVVFGITCFWVVLLMYVFYAREELTAELDGRRDSLGGPERTFRRARRAWLVMLAVLAFAFLVMAASAVVTSRGVAREKQAWADALGVAVAALACVQWVPQAVTTWRLGHLGSLSLLSICISAPYTWLFGLNLAIRVGPAGWSAWIVYLLVGTMQLVLIAMGVSFKLTGETAPHEVKRPGSIVNFHFDGWEHATSGMSSVFGSRRNSMASTHVAPDEHRPLLAGWMRAGSGSQSQSRSRPRASRASNRGRAADGEGVGVGPDGQCSDENQR